MKKIIILLLVTLNLFAKTVEYKVQKGDSLSKIASKFIRKTRFIHSSNLIKEIKKNNNIKRYAGIGKILKIEILDERLKTKRIKKPKKVKALYFPLGSVYSTYFLKRVKNYKREGINSVVIDIKTMTGKITIPYKSKLKDEVKGEKHWQEINLNKLLYYLHKENIYVIVRMVSFHDIAMSDAKKEFRVFPKGKHRKWVNPANKEVQNYLLGLVDTVLKYPVDELQLDYIRFPASGAKGCTKFKRRDIILDFLKKVKKKTQKVGIDLGVDVFGIVLWSGKDDLCNLGQDLRKMADIVDVISPMIYPSHFASPFHGIDKPGDSPKEMISMSTRRINYLFKDKDVEIRPYLQGFKHGSTNYDENYVINEINSLNNRGYIFWSAVGKYKSVAKALYLLKSHNKKKKKSSIRQNKKKNLTNNPNFKKNNLIINKKVEEIKLKKKDKTIDDIMNDIVK